MLAYVDHPGVVAADEVARLKSPVLFHHGTADRSVDVGETKKLEAALKGQNTPVELFVYDGADGGQSIGWVAGESRAGAI
jgi:dienelactone hydrolase